MCFWIEQVCHTPGLIDTMPKYSFIARVPNHPGALHNAARVVMREKANINRVQFDQRIDPSIVFFEISCPEEAYGRIEEGLAGMGYSRIPSGP